MEGVALMEKGFFHPDRGYWQTVSDPSPSLLAKYPEGTIEVSLKPSPLHTFDGSSWVPPTQAELDAAKATQVRAERDQRLLTVDAIAGNALRWAALDADTQTAWAAYRQALLDVPQQAGFPNDVTWPEEPTA